ncbi:c-type cytochrome, partial [Cronobacter sakazakii]
MIKHGVLLASLMALSVTAQAKGDAAAGEEKAVMCVACHGATGKA